MTPKLTGIVKLLRLIQAFPMKTSETLPTFNFFNFAPAFWGGGGLRTSTVRPELVEGLSFPFPGPGEAKGFDKLSPNGFHLCPVHP